MELPTQTRCNLLVPAYLEGRGGGGGAKPRRDRCLQETKVLQRLPKSEREVEDVRRCGSKGRNERKRYEERKTENLGRKLRSEMKSARLECNQ